MKKCIISLIALCAILVSCEQDKVIFDESQTFVRFEEANPTVSVPIGRSASVEVPITVSSLSSSERSIAVEVIEEETTVESGQYTLGSIVVPANSYEGMLKIDVEDSGAESDAKVLVLHVPNSAEVSGGNAKLTVNVFQICPIPNTAFVGNYYMEQIAPIPFLFGQSTLTHDTVVAVTAESDTRRTFDTFTFPYWCSTEIIPFKFDLVCGKIIVPIQDGNCGCGDIGYFAPAVTPSTYDLDDDNVFELTFTGDASEACSASAGVQVTYRFTKQ